MKIQRGNEQEIVLATRRSLIEQPCVKIGCAHDKYLASERTVVIPCETRMKVLRLLTADDLSSDESFSAGPTIEPGSETGSDSENSPLRDPRCWNRPSSGFD